MTDNLPAIIPESVPAVIPAPVPVVYEPVKFKSIKQPYPADITVCLMLSAILVCVLVKPIAAVDMMGWWWGPFIVINMIYMIHGLRKGTMKSDPANALIITLGPITFYFWTFIEVWRKYYKYKKDGYGRTIWKLEAALRKCDLKQGIDFEFLNEHKKHVLRFLKWQKLCVEEVIDPYVSKDDGKCWWCLSITDTPENMVLREEER